MSLPNPSLLTSPEGDAIEARGASRAQEVTVNLAGANVNLKIGQPFRVIQAFTVKTLTGAVVPTVKLDSYTNPAVALALGEIRADLYVTGGLFISNVAGGGTLVLEIHGR